MKEILILAGLSGSGKDAVCTELLKCGYERIISSTTRPMREGEKDGREYHFLTEEEFRAKRAEGIFFEEREVPLNGKPVFYGSERISPAPGKRYVTILDMNGIQAYAAEYGMEHLFIAEILIPEDIRMERAWNRKAPGEAMEGPKWEKFLDEWLERTEADTAWADKLEQIADWISWNTETPGLAAQEIMEAQEGNPPLWSRLIPYPMPLSVTCRRAFREACRKGTMDSRITNSWFREDLKRNGPERWDEGSVSEWIRQSVERFRAQKSIK